MLGKKGPQASAQEQHHARSISHKMRWHREEQFAPISICPLKKFVNRDSCNSSRQTTPSFDNLKLHLGLLICSKPADSPLFPRAQDQLRRAEQKFVASGFTEVETAQRITRDHARTPHADAN